MHTLEECTRIYEIGVNICKHAGVFLDPILPHCSAKSVVYTTRLQYRKCKTRLYQNAMLQFATELKLNYVLWEVDKTINEFEWNHKTWKCFSTYL